MPREAPVTIATLVLSWVIFNLLSFIARNPLWMTKRWTLSAGRIMPHDLASQSENREQIDGPVRCDARVLAGGGAAELHARGRGSRPATLDGDGCRKAARSAARRAALAADDASCQSDARWRGLSPALSRAHRRSGGCRGGVRRRQAQGAAARRCPRHPRTSFPAAAPAGFPRGISRN